MNINYDPQADAIYIELRKGEVENSLEVGNYIFVDVDADGVPLGLEILFANRLLTAQDLTNVTVRVMSYEL